MAEQFTTLASLTVYGKGSYGIGASAVPFSKDLYTYLRITDIKDDGTLNLQDLKSVDDEKASEYLLKPNDIVFARTGASTGRNYFYDETDGELVYAGFLIKFSIDEKKINPKFIKYFCQSKQYKDWINSFNTGSTRGNINAQTLGKMPIPLIERKIQDTLVSVLSSIDEKIKQNSEINNNLEQQVSILYQSWFEDFEITKGVCPENWSYQELSTIADIASGKRPPVKSDICNQETPISIVGAASVMGFTSEANQTDKILVTGRVGTHGVIQRFNTPCWTSDNTLVITSPYYEFTNQILHRIDYSSMNRGSTQPLITQGDMKKVVVLVPDEHTLAKFEEFAGSLMAKWEANNNENVKLASLRDTLLPKLISGEVDVSDINL